MTGCVCEHPFFGYDCSLRLCPTGDDPLTEGQVNEVQLFTCDATGGSLVFFYRGKPTVNIPVSSSSGAVKAALESHPDISEVVVTFNPTDVASVCQASPTNVVRVEFTQDFGSLPPLVPYLAKLSSPGGSPGGGTAVAVTVSRGGESVLYDSNSLGYHSTSGSKEAEACSGRGYCDRYDGECECFTSRETGDTYASSDGYGGLGGREDCGAPVPALGGGARIRACPGDLVSCSGHGACNTTSMTCECWQGYESGDCSQRACPLARPWFAYPTADEEAHSFAKGQAVPCANAGICDQGTGTCTCANWVTGAACEHMVCGAGEGGPGAPTSPCSGHGRCLSQSELALEATRSNGGPANFTYGLDPSKASTWDGASVMGCKCDRGFEGAFCSERACPLGDDPNTRGQANERQLIRCEAEGGTFTLAFRGASTGAIAFDASALEVEAALELLPSVGDLSVAFSGAATKACFGGYDPCSVMVVQFQTEHGDLPSLRADGEELTDAVMGASATSGIAVYQNGAAPGAAENCAFLDQGVTSVRGTTESLACSRRGLCDRGTGLCKCFAGYGPSDGLGGAGAIMDCGFVLGSDRAGSGD
eukprot:CAMPEP_0172605252 /NCGR_PEP_ID=MMETSP1068-20121228/25483_1 /TAXON_ID=35684 /ORGANISM="Pseudopedinella elastica, Strain CCMP716" /LENGTH=590 /DNA_ID=CAMNT_0013407595 /DNA_START=507 /DNA_END=2279 /DNA_ORIENTATION=+